MQRTRISLAIFAAVAALTLAGCGEDGKTDPRALHGVLPEKSQNILTLLRPAVPRQTPQSRLNAGLFQHFEPYFLTDSTHFTSALTSASGTEALGGIGI